MSSTTFIRGEAPRRIAAVLVVIAGIVLVVSTFANNLFNVGPAFENMMNDFRPILTQQSIDSANQALDGMQKTSDEIQTKMLPGLAQQAHMTTEQFAASIATQFPAVGKGLQTLPTAVPQFKALVSTLDQQRPLFASADAIPTKNLPATTVPWGLFAAGLLTIVVGIVMWFTARIGAVLAAVLGAVLVVAAVVMTLPGKASDADQLNANLKPVYTQQMVNQGKASLVTLGAMGAQMQSAMLPALAQQTGMSAAQLQQWLVTNFPATAASLVTLPTNLEKFTGMVKVFDDNLDNYGTLKPVAFEPIIWTLIAVGGAVFLLGLIALFVGRGKPERVQVEGMPKPIVGASR
jgi:uncharacterized membrane protein HdeD (DUF308 family)